MRIGFSCGYTECYWGEWFGAKQIGGSEAMVVELACELAAQGHRVTVRLPYPAQEAVHRGVRWVSLDAPPQDYDLLFCFDDFARRDRAATTCLVVCRSDPPPHKDFNHVLYLSPHHARVLGDPGGDWAGAGVRLEDFATLTKRQAGLVICTSSPDRCTAAFRIGAHFPRFTFTYKPVPGLPPTKMVTREELVCLKKQAMVQIYPLDPSRPSDFFSISNLEAMAAGTPVVCSDADSMVELWSDTAIILPRPVVVEEWVEAVERLLRDKDEWGRYSEAGRVKAAAWSWENVARRYLEKALEA